MYRRLAKKTHPDMFRDEVQKKEAEENFKLLGKHLNILVTLRFHLNCLFELFDTFCIKISLILVFFFFLILVRI